MSFSVRAPDGLREILSSMTGIPSSVRSEMEGALAEELILLEEDLRGPTAGSPGGGAASGPHALSPGPGLVPINTGRLLSSMDAQMSGLSAVMTADAQDPRSGFFYASVAHHEGGYDGETVDLITERWELMAEQASERMAAILTEWMEVQP